MSYAIRSPAGPVELTPGASIVAGDVQFSYDTMTMWSDVERADYCITAIVEPDPVPAGKISTGSMLSDDGTTVRRVLALADAPPTPVLDISDRQFGRGLWGDGVITFDECEAFVSTGVIPAALQKLIDALPDDDTGKPTARKEAIIFVRGAKDYERGNAFVDELGQAFGWAPAQIDDKWRAWSAL